MRLVSRDLTLRRPRWSSMADGTTMTALGGAVGAAGRGKPSLHGRQRFGAPKLVGGSGEVAFEVLDRWERCSAAWRAIRRWRSPGQVDWVAKLSACWRDSGTATHSTGTDSPACGALDLQYHDLRPESLAATGGALRRSWTMQTPSVQWAANPPPDTRAYFRGRCLQKFAADVVAANWDFDRVRRGRGDSLRRVPMLEPARGTVEHVGTILEESETASELLDALGA